MIIELPKKPIDRYEIISWNSLGDVPKRIIYTYYADTFRSDIRPLFKSSNDAPVIDSWVSDSGMQYIGWQTLKLLLDNNHSHSTFDAAKIICLRRMKDNLTNHLEWAEKLQNQIISLESTTAPT